MSTGLLSGLLSEDPRGCKDLKEKADENIVDTQWNQRHLGRRVRGNRGRSESEHRQPVNLNTGSQFP